MFLVTLAAIVPLVLLMNLTVLPLLERLAAGGAHPGVLRHADRSDDLGRDAADHPAVPPLPLRPPGVSRLACVLLVDPRGWLLLQERDENAPIAPDCWGMVGGHVEPGEDFEVAVYRELAEETGIVWTPG